VAGAEKGQGTALLAGNFRSGLTGSTIDFCHKYSGVRLRQIAAKFDVGETAIIEASRRFEKKMDSDEKLRRDVEKVKGVLNSE